MTDLRKAAEIALEALSFFGNNVTNPAEEFITSKAIVALRQALAQPEQEPVAWLEYDDEGYLFLSGKRKGAFPVFTAKPSKPWVSLTDEEADILITLHAPPIHPDFNDDDDFIELVNAIEAKLKEKNA